MAKKKAPKKSHHRRRSMSGTGGGTMQTLLAVGVGALAGRFLNNMATNKLKLAPTMSAVGTAGVGFGIAYFIKNPMFKGFGYGVLAAGAIGTGIATGIISGAPNSFRVIMPDNSRINGAGLTNLKSINGAGLTNLKTINGNGYRSSRINGSYEGEGALH